MSKDFRDKLRNPGCEICALHKGADFVCLMGSGPPRAKIMIVGEAPGAREDEEHRAFTGKAGQLLDLALKEYAQIDRDECYVTNVVHCRPPNNRTPELKEIKACVESYFWEEVRQVRPEFMLLLGNSALKGVTKKSGITKQAGSVWDLQLAGMPVKVMPTLHPAAVLRNPKYVDLFTSDIAGFGRMVRGAKSDVDTRIKIVRTPAQLKWLLEELSSAPVIAVDLETYTKPAPEPYVHTNFQDWHPDHSKIVSIAFSWKEGHAAVVPIYHVSTPWKDPDRVLEVLAPALTRKDVKIVNHNLKFDARWLHSKGIPVKQTFCTMLAAHMLEENRTKGLKPLSRMILGADAYDVGEELDAAHKIPLRRLCVYNGKDTDYTLRLYRVFKEQLKQEDQKRTARVFAKLMMPASNALVDIERKGVWVDPTRWQERHDQAQENVAKLYRYVNKFVSADLRPINLRSPPQVAKWLFDDLNLPVLELTKSKNPSTREGVILQLALDHEIPALKALLKYRKWAKYLNTYLLPWWFEHRDRNGRIHSNYKLFGTVTGRLSGEGGIQQVPRDPFIRSIIGAPPGWVFLQADYSQIELRIAAMISHERAMLNAYYRGHDIHMQRAMRMTGKLAKDVTKEERKKAKAVNFGFLYGMGYNKFVTYSFENYDLRVSESEAKQARENFFTDYPALRGWHDRQRRLARRYQVVYSPLGRARHLPDINSHDKDVQAEAERQAINSPVQSTASDMMLNSLVELHNIMDPREAFIVGTVHDSILFEVKEGLENQYAKLIKETMEDIARIERIFQCDITVPIVADIEIGNHWAEGKPWEGP